MKQFELKILVLVFTFLGIISFISSDYFEGILLLIISFTLLLIDSFPEKISHYFRGSSQPELK